MGIEFGGLIGLVILALDIWAIINIIGSSATTGTKVVWVLVVLILPIIGLVVWLVAGPRKAGSIV